MASSEFTVRVIDCEGARAMERWKYKKAARIKRRARQRRAKIDLDSEETHCHPRKHTLFVCTYYIRFGTIVYSIRPR
jgi:hypothetical protein